MCYNSIYILYIYIIYVYIPGIYIVVEVYTLGYLGANSG